MPGQDDPLGTFGFKDFPRPCEVIVPRFQPFVKGFGKLFSKFYASLSEGTYHLGTVRL